MEPALYLYNTLNRKKELFQPLKAPFVGMYVCGPTVYGEPHLGHARPAITFDVLFRYLQHLGYRVRYVRNITDVGHITTESDDEGVDRIGHQARVEQLEPMEVAQHYTDMYHFAMDRLNVRRPSIEPRASGHIMEQIALVQKILDAGFAYISNGSVYFDVAGYNEKFKYGKLSGRNIEDLIANTRTLDGQDEKRSPLDFALWKKASPEHIMRWPSGWSEGFPGWHLECTAMSAKYLGENFDIHGGGMDLMFPHHECEIAQSVSAYGKEPVRYWLHNNMITVNGQKMGKSLNNFITLNQFFSGSHEALVQAYSPMTIRFFILQAHYRGTVDFSNDALQAAEKAMKKLLASMETAGKIKPAATSSFAVKPWIQSCYDAMNDDLNTPILIAQLFEAVRVINSAADGKETLTSEDLESLRQQMQIFVSDILGILPETAASEAGQTDALMSLIIELRKQARANKDYATSDKIRDALQQIGISIKDTKDGAEWKID